MVKRWIPGDGFSHVADMTDIEYVGPHGHRVDPGIADQYVLAADYDALEGALRKVQAAYQTQCEIYLGDPLQAEIDALLSDSPAPL